MLKFIKVTFPVRSDLFLGCTLRICLTDFGETSELLVKDLLERKHFDCIQIGAGIRMITGNTMLFSKLLNVAHMHAPHARLSFNTRLTDTVEAVQC